MHTHAHTTYSWICSYTSHTFVLCCRLDTKENCDKTIEMLNGSTLPESAEPLMVKFADSSSNKKRQNSPGGCVLLHVVS